MKKISTLAAVAAFSALGAQAQFISEMAVNPPGNDVRGGLQYIELTGLANARLADNLWVISIDCGPAVDDFGVPEVGVNLGAVLLAVPLTQPGTSTPLSFGANGVLLLRDGGLVTGGIPVNPTLISIINGTNTGPDPLTNVVFYNTPFVSNGLNYFGFPAPTPPGDTPNDAVTIMLVKGGDWLNIADVDVNDDGTIDAGVLDGVTVLDAVSYKADGTTASSNVQNSQTDYADEVGGLSFGLFQGTRTWEPDSISRVLDAATGGPAVGLSYDTRGWVLGDSLPSGSNAGPLIWDEGADEVWFFTDPRGLFENPFGRPTNYAIATPEFPNQTERARLNPGWRNIAVNGPSRKVSGQVAFQGASGTLPTTARIELVYHGMLASQPIDVTLASDGSFTADVPMGVYQIAVKPKSFLRRLSGLVNTGAADVTGVVLEVLAGDIDGDNTVTVFDYDKLSTYFDKSSADADWSTADGDGVAPKDADLDLDGSVTVFDYDLLSTNFDLIGD